MGSLAARGAIGYKDSMPLLLLLFVVVPFVEFTLLVQVGARIGALPTVMLVVATGVLGASLARQQGLATLQRLQGDLAAGRQPTAAMLEGVLILLAGVVLITPGFLTDAFGLALLIPVTRRFFLQGMSRALERQVRQGRVDVRFGMSGNPAGGRPNSGEGSSGPGSGAGPGGAPGASPFRGGPRPAARRPTGLAPDGSPVIDVPVDEVRGNDETTGA